MRIILSQWRSKNHAHYRSMSYSKFKKNDFNNTIREQQTILRLVCLLFYREKKCNPEMFTRSLELQEKGLTTAQLLKL